MQYCENRIVTCPILECGKQVHQKNLQFHLNEECVSAQTRKSLLKLSAERLAKKKELEAQLLEAEKLEMQFISKEPFSAKESKGEEKENSAPKVLICPQCGEGVKESLLSIHMKERCFFRPISCPNYGVGCNEIAIPLNNIEMHLLHECKAEKLKEEMIVKSKKRDEYIQCSTCGYQVELRNWKKHERELCENRLVQCKNHVLGCSVMVPMSERDLHELIDENYERFCLYFSGHGSYVHVLESDIACPWTAEFWLYRPLPQDSLRIHLRNFFNLLSSYEIAFLSEIVTHNKVMKIVNALKDDSLTAKPSSRDGKKLSKAEKQKLQNEQMQLKMNLLNELTSLIPVYSDAVLAYIRAFQPVAICIEAVILFLLLLNFFIILLVVGLLT